jgi:hypothetical protein
MGIPNDKKSPVFLADVPESTFIKAEDSVILIELNIMAVETAIVIMHKEYCLISLNKLFLATLIKFIKNHSPLKYFEF